MSRAVDFEPEERVRFQFFLCHSFKLIYINYPLHLKASRVRKVYCWRSLVEHRFYEKDLIVRWSQHECVFQLWFSSIRRANFHRFSLIRLSYQLQLLLLVCDALTVLSGPPFVLFGPFVIASP